jgi:hypothetical protein
MRMRTPNSLKTEEKVINLPCGNQTQGGSKKTTRQRNSNSRTKCVSTYNTHNTSLNTCQPKGLGRWWPEHLGPLRRQRVVSFGPPESKSPESGHSVINLKWHMKSCSSWRLVRRGACLAPHHRQWVLPPFGPNIQLLSTGVDGSARLHKSPAWKTSVAPWDYYPIRLYNLQGCSDDLLPPFC